jgi:alginate O-acetyltransferase complex protein AlgI
MSPVVILIFTSLLFFFSIFLFKIKRQKFLRIIFPIASVVFFIKYNINGGILILALWMINIALSTLAPRLTQLPLFPIFYAVFFISLKKIFHWEITGFSYVVIAASMDVVLQKKNLYKIRASFDNLLSFPKTLIGPIANLNQHQDRTVDNEGYYFLFKGILKAFLLSNIYRQYLPLEDFQQYGHNVNFVLLGLWQYINLYLEFSGYSDVVYGIYRSMGKDCPINFQRPYFSDTLKDFWNRWHMSLGHYIRHYIYIPLGGNRRGEVRTYLNLIVAMTLCGLWHGLTDNFAIWGLMQGVGLSIEKYFDLERKIKNKLCRWLATQTYVTLSWSVFFS